ncbi:MAG TPA: thiolase family protein [Sporichthyaceae bacterium]|nr:thiolase family protein [Sporichthyaceae bacterium]
MTDVVVAGAAMTAFGKFPAATARSLAEEAVRDALADAELAPADVAMVFFANAAAGLITGQEMIRGQVALRHTGLLGAPIVNVENACASASTALYLAVNAVRSGQVEVALAIGAEKMAIPDKARAFAAIGAAVDLDQLDELRAWAAADGAADVVGDRSMFMDVYAALTRAYMARSGATATDFAEVAVKSHEAAKRNPKAQYRNPVTVAEVLASRPVSPPLTLLMCSPIGDGAAAVVVCAPHRRRGSGPVVKVAASVLVSGMDRGPDEPSAVERAAHLAYEAAGVGPADMDVIEVHDAAAPAELMAYEELGLCAPGDGPKLLQSGHTRFGGPQVVNPSGGLLSKGHPIGATGCAQVVELVDQLRGRCGHRQVPGARLALAENGGGFLGADNAALVVTVLAV